MPTSIPRNDIPNDPDEWRHLLDTSLEHASIVASLLSKGDLLHYTDPEHIGWPPNSSDDVGSVGYHFAAFVVYVCEVFWSIAKFYPEKDE